VCHSKDFNFSHKTERCKKENAENGKVISIDIKSKCLSSYLVVVDHYKVYICTNKTDLGEAQRYIDNNFAGSSIELEPKFRIAAALGFRPHLEQKHRAMCGTNAAYNKC
jgi:hypothetical protein